MKYLKALLITCLLALALPALAYDCLPSNYNGTGTALATGGTDEGDWYEWACPIQQVDGGVIWRSQTYAVVSSVQVPSLSVMDVLAAILAAPNPLAAFNEAVTRLHVPPTESQTGAFNRLHFFARQHGFYNDPKPVPGGVWLVAVNGTAATRQWYAYDAASDVLGARTSGATVGAPCRPSVAWTSTVSNGVVTYYMAFGSNPVPTRVTVCTRQP